jgi:Arc/MetJ family transcription regulator
MTKRHIEIDDDLLEQVRAFFGTRTLKDTVNCALYEIAQYPARLAVIDRWVFDPDADSSEVQAMGEAWRQDLDTLSTRARSSGCISSPCTQASTHSADSDSSPPVP